MRSTDTVEASASLTQADIKRNNAALVMRAIRDNPGLTRAQLAERLRITKVGVARHVDDLIAAGLITEEPVATGARGRPGLQLVLAVGSFYGLGYDLRIDRRREVVYDLAGTVRGQRPVIADRHPTFAAIVAEIAESVAAAEEREPGRLVGVAVAVPGRFDSAWANIDRSFYGGPEPYPILAELRAAIGPGVRVTTLDIPAAAATALSSATGLDDLIHIQIGVAAGMASTADRRSATLPVSLAIGHLPLELDGRPCACGRRGCADTRISFDDLAGRVRDAGLRLPDDPGADIRLAAAIIGQACDTGQADVIAAVAESARWIALVAAQVIHIRAPQALTIGGYPLALGRHFEEPFRRHLDRLVENGAQIYTETSLGDDASLLGTALASIEPLFDDPLSLSAAKRPTAGRSTGSPVAT